MFAPLPSVTDGCLKNALAFMNEGAGEGPILMRTEMGPKIGLSPILMRTESVNFQYAALTRILSHWQQTQYFAAIEAVLLH